MESPDRSQGSCYVVDYAKRFRTTSATPNRPVPSRANVEGSGVTLETGVKVPLKKASKTSSVPVRKESTSTGYG